MNEKKKIQCFIELLFENIPYSIENNKIKESIIEKLIKESDNNHSFEELISQYNTLESLCFFAGFRKETYKKLKSKKNVITIENIKKDFIKKKKKNLCKPYCLDILSSLLTKHNISFF